MCLSDADALRETAGEGGVVTEATAGRAKSAGRAKPLDRVKVVTICRRNHVGEGYVARCTRSWRRIRGASGRLAMIDAGLGDDGQAMAREMGFEVYGPHSRERDAALKGREALKTIRRKWLTWRKVVDPVVHFRDEPYVLIIDTDVLVTRPIALPDAGYDFAYSCDPVPAYRGRWHLPLRERMLLSLNAGFLLVRPAAVDLDELNRLAERYFLNTRMMWWTAQSVWSVVMAASERTAMFDGRDVRTIAGNDKQTHEQMVSNRVKLFGGNRAVADEAEMGRLIQGAAVLHFASRGKRWIDYADDNDREGVADAPEEAGKGEADVLRVMPARRATWLERLVICGRMAAKSVQDRRVLRRLERRQQDSAERGAS